MRGKDPTGIGFKAASWIRNDPERSKSLSTVKIPNEASQEHILVNKRTPVKNILKWRLMALR